MAPRWAILIFESLPRLQRVYSTTNQWTLPEQTLEFTDPNLALIINVHKNSIVPVYTLY